MKPIARCVFTMPDQEVFAALSGDWNPVHLDPVASRRTLFGGPVIHGIGGLIWLLGAAVPGRAVDTLEARFLRPIRVGDPAEALVEAEDSGGLTLVIRSAYRIATRVRVSLGHPLATPIASRLHEPAAPQDMPFADLADAEGEEPLVWDSDRALAFYGKHSAEPASAAALAALTRIVGMRCPGLHSLFAGVRIRRRGPATPLLRYRVTRTDARFASLRIGFEGGGYVGELDAFCRPRPVVQVSMAEARRLVGDNAFRGWRFLVIGGSRGLGETAAKLVAAGGGRVCITYRYGRDDALCLVRGGAAEAALPFDAAADAWPDLPWTPTHAAYFATPRISLADHGPDEKSAYRTLYVEGFARIVRRIAATGQPCSILYPSTIFIETRPPGSEAYRTAKEEGEALCARLATEYPHLRFLAPRIPVTATDQTASLAGPPASPAHEILLPLLRAL